VWSDLFADDDVGKVAIDTHGYIAWNDPHDNIKTYCDEFEARGKLL
jgi:hypothetical protein